MTNKTAYTASMEHNDTQTAAHMIAVLRDRAEYNAKRDEWTIRLRGKGTKHLIAYLLDIVANAQPIAPDPGSAAATLSTFRKNAAEWLAVAVKNETDALAADNADDMADLYSDAGAARNIARTWQQAADLLETTIGK